MLFLYKNITLSLLLGIPTKVGKRIISLFECKGRVTEDAAKVTFLHSRQSEVGRDDSIQ